MTADLEQVRDRLSGDLRASGTYTTDLTGLRGIADALSDNAGTVVTVQETHTAHAEDINVTVTFSFTLDADTAEQVVFE